MITGLTTAMELITEYTNYSNYSGIESGIEYMGRSPLYALSMRKLVTKSNGVCFAVF